MKVDDLRWMMLWEALESRGLPTASWHGEKNEK